MRNFRVYLDTNSLFVDEEPFDEVINIVPHRLQEFIHQNDVKNRVKVHVPEIVLKERVQQRLEQIKRIESSFSQNLNVLRGLGYTYPEITLDIDYKNVLLKKGREKLLNKNVVVSNLPAIDGVLVDRAIAKIKPFGAGKYSDAGLKDTLIYLTLLQDAREATEEVFILCTKDSGFDESVADEFFVKLASSSCSQKTNRQSKKFSIKNCR